LKKQRSKNPREPQVRKRIGKKKEKTREEDI
jgi:hypothetical protein